MKNSIAIAVVVALVLAGTGYWYFFLAGAPGADMMQNANTQSADQTGDQSAAQNTPQTFPVLATSNSATLGDYLTSQGGVALYTYDKDTSATSSCADVCVVNWPPFLVPNGVVFSATDAVTGSIGTITRDDGGLQLTYNGKPLYFYANDSAPGDTKGDGVNDVWHIAKP